MTPEALRRLALSLPEAREEPHFHRTSFRVGKRIFATLTPDGREAMVKLPDPGDAEDLIASHPDVFFGHGKWTTNQGALGVRLPKASAAMMRELVTAAWAAIAPKRALAAHRGGPGRGGRRASSE